MVVNDPHWQESVQLKWNEVRVKIVKQGSMEAPNKTKMRTILEEVDENGKYINGLHNY